MGAAQQIGTGWQRAGIDPVCALQVFGMRRSGNHAIIDWIMRNAPDAASGGLFHNDCRYGDDPLEAFASLEVFGKQATLIPSEGRPADRRRAEAGAQPLVFVSYEDRPPAAGGKRQKASLDFGNTDFTHSVKIYRSFLNWSASLLAKLKRNPGYGLLERLRIMMMAMPSYAKMLIRVAKPEHVGVCYDAWVTSEAYQADVLTTLGLEARDNGLGQVQRFGGGSSFQKKVRDPAQLESTARDAAMAEDTEYQLLLWTAAHDVAFVETLIAHFRDDAERLVTLAENARLDITLSSRKAPK